MGSRRLGRRRLKSLDDRNSAASDEWGFEHDFLCLGFS